MHNSVLHELYGQIIKHKKNAKMDAFKYIGLCMKPIALYAAIVVVVGSVVVDT